MDKYKNQKNYKLIDTENGQLLVSKCESNDKPAIRLSMAVEHPEMFLKPEVTISFKSTQFRNEDFEAFGQEKAEAAADFLFEEVESFIKKYDKE